jgi:hypothetical protein
MGRRQLSQLYPRGTLKPRNRQLELDLFNFREHNRPQFTGNTSKTKGVRSMNRRASAICSVAILTLAILALPAAGRAQQANTQDDGAFVLGSILFSILHLPVKLATCVGTQATAAVAYTATFGVRGNYDGGTNGRDIGEVARRSCTGAWLVTPSQVKSDYGE